MNTFERVTKLLTVLVAITAAMFIANVHLAFGADKEGYEPVDVNEFKLGLAVSELSFSNGGQCVASASGVELRINDYLLKFKGVSNCKLDTEELGPVKLIGTGPFGAQLWLTPDQKAKAKMLK
jgi:hypothetical protein